MLGAGRCGGQGEKTRKKIRFIRATILNCEFSFETHHLLRIFASLQNLRKNFPCKKNSKKIEKPIDTDGGGVDYNEKSYFIFFRRNLMKRFKNGLAVFAILVGLLGVTSCVSIGELVGNMFGGGANVAFFDGQQTKATYLCITLKENGKLEAMEQDGRSKTKGTWEASTAAIKGGTAVTVTIGDKTEKGTVVVKSRQYVPGNDQGERGYDPYYLIKATITFATLGTYTYDMNEAVESVK